MTQTVLVADDSKTIRTIIEMALKASPYEVIQAENARGVMEVLRRQRPDLIVLDYHMPDASGYDVCRAIKNNAAVRHIPIVMLGGSFKNFDEDRARRSGADAILMKPFKTDQLYGALEQVTGGGAHTASTANAGQPAVAASAPASEPPPRPSGTQRININQVHDDGPSPLRPPTPAASVGGDTSGAGASRPPFGQPSPLGGGSPLGSVTPPPRPFGQPAQPAQPAAPALPRTPTPTPSTPAIGGSQPRIMRNSGSQPNIPTPDINASSRPTPGASSSGAIKPPGPVAAGVSREELEEIVREEVKNAVKAELPNLLKGVVGELFQQKLMPRLTQHAEQQINTTINDQLNSYIQQQVRAELESLLGDD